MSTEDVTLTDSVLHKLAAEYTREAGVRNLERAIARVLRKVATDVAMEKVTLPVTVGRRQAQGLPGPAQAHAGIRRAHLAARAWRPASR